MRKIFFENRWPGLEIMTILWAWHYALNISEESDSAKYVCTKTLWNIRNTVIEHGFKSLLFECATNKMAFVFKVNTDKQQIDSVHIQSNMRRLGRISIFAKSIHKFLINLKRGHKELFDSVEESILDRYLSEQALGCFATVKPSGARRTLVPENVCTMFEATLTHRRYPITADIS